MKKSTLKEILKNPLTYIALCFGVFIAPEYWLTARNEYIHRTYDKISAISKEHVAPFFKQEQKKIGLESQAIDLSMEEENEYKRGQTEKIGGGHKVTIYAPYTKVTIRHELSHVRDSVDGKVKIPYRKINVFENYHQVVSELRAQKYSIAEMQKK